MVVGSNSFVDHKAMYANTVVRAIMIINANPFCNFVIDTILIFTIQVDAVIAVAFKSCANNIFSKNRVYKLQKNNFHNWSQIVQ